MLETLLSSSLAQRFHLVVVSTFRDSGRLGKALRALLGIGRSALLLVTSRVDLVYLQASSGFSFRRKAVVAALARSVRRPYVVHVHASDFDSYYRSASAWEQWLVRRTLGRAALVIALSPTWERRILEIVTCTTTSIPNPVAIPSAAAPLDVRPARIVCMGRLGERKGSVTLVRALSLLDGRHADAELTLAGDGDQAPIRREADERGVTHRVELPGWIGPEERARTLHTASIFALPSREEGLPVALLEAMAYGLPSIVTAVGGIPDVFEEGRHGYLVPADDPAALADRLGRLLDEPETARRMGEQARADATQRYAIDVVAARLGDALAGVIDEHRRAEAR